MLTERDMLIANLSFIYRLIVASETLLTRAERRALEIGDFDNYDYFKHHQLEETGHAKLLADDLHELGVDHIPRFHLAELMAGSQYYLIEHEHPAALLGYIAALECSPMPMTAVDELEKQYGALRCLRLHAEKDPQHGREVLAQMKKLPDDLKRLAEINYQRTKQQLEAAPGVIFAALGKDEARH